MWTCLIKILLCSHLHTETPTLHQNSFTNHQCVHLVQAFETTDSVFRKWWSLHCLGLEIVWINNSAEPLMHFQEMHDMNPYVKNMTILQHKNFTRSKGSAGSSC